MKIRFLGTGHGDPMPGRHYQSMLIETENQSYLVDAGAPVLDILISENYDLTKIKAVFVTHMHRDHMLGLVDLMYFATYYYKEMSFEVYLPEQRGVKAIKEFVSMLLYGQVTDRVGCHVIENKDFFDDGTLKVTAVPTEHMSATTNISYGFILEADRKRVYVTGDMNGSLKDFPVKLLSDPFDAIVSECAHFSAERLIEKLNEVNVKKAIIVHVFPMDKYDELKCYSTKASFQILLPDDGDVIEL